MFGERGSVIRIFYRGGKVVMRKRVNPWRSLGLLLAALSILLWGLAPASAEMSSGQRNGVERYGGVYRRPLSDNPSSLDPARTSDVHANTVVNQVFDGLLQFDVQLNLRPAIAEFWEASPDGLTWTFYLRKGVTFHNGRPVTADDFVYSFTRILDPALQSPVAEFFMNIDGAEEFHKGKAPVVKGLKALDPYTLQVTLQEPYAPFLSVLAMANAKVVPREEVEKPGAEFATHPVGSGPFRFVRWDQNREIVLQAYPDYYEGRPFLDQIIFKIGKKDLDNFTDFLHGTLEEAKVPASKRAEVRTDPRYRDYLHIRRPILHLLYIGFNTRKEPFTNPKVRQAFNYAVNKEVIVREIRKRGDIVAHAILPPIPGYSIDPEGYYYYSPERARQLLAEAGYPGGKGLPVIDIWTNSKEETTRKEMEAYQKYLADIGVTLEIHRAPNWPTFKKMLQAGKPSMFRLAWYADIPDPDNFFFPLLYSQSKTNRTFYHNPQVDRLLQEARQETDFLQRIAIYRKVEKLAMEDAPWISQHHKVFEYLYQPYVRGIEVNSLGTHYIPMKKIWLKRPGAQQAQRVD
ncbi:MAG: ABC transporter substrate-binding protein [Nitrospinota bacterium]|nr:MAG: ABC transporter substrate-binding protein [Nitrospinota bacterium]